MPNTLFYQIDVLDCGAAPSKFARGYAEHDITHQPLRESHFLFVNF